MLFTLGSEPLRILAVWAVVVIVAFLVGRFAPARRESVRQVVVPALLVTALEGLLYVTPESWLGVAVREPLHHMSWLLSWMFAANAAGLLVFAVLLPRFFAIARITHDLSLGVSYVLILLVFLRRFGVDFSSLLATSAVVTGIVAISMQSTLGNAFGGLTLQLDRSVTEGDWIRLDDGTEGRVCAVRWRHTVIETRNWDTVIVPNSLLVGQKFMILGKREGQPLQHRMWVNFNVDFRYAPADVIEAVESGLRAAPIPGAAESPRPNCVCMDFVQTDSAARYAVRYWLTNLAADDPTSSLVRARIFAALRRAKIPLAVPAKTVFVENHNNEDLERKAEKRLQRRREAVERMPLCRRLTSDEKDKVARHLKFVPFAPGEIISREGAAAHWLYILDRGRVDIRIGNGKEEVVINTLQAPDYFGENGMLTGAPRTATAIALTEVECFRLDRETFNELLHDRPEIAHDVAEVLAQRQEELARVRDALASSENSASRAERHTQLLDRIQKFFGLSGAS